jgi:hypothetical protein
VKARHLLIVSLAVFSSCNSAVPAAPSSLAQSASPTGLPAVGIAVLGDSIASGTGASGQDAIWWVRTQVALRKSGPPVTFTNRAQAGSGIDFLERTARAVDGKDYRIAVVIEGRNDPIDDAAWRPRFSAVVDALEAKSITVVLATYPPDFVNGTLTEFPRNGMIRTIALAGHRALMDFEARWRAAGPAIAGAWYTDQVHANDLGQQIEAEVAIPILQPLVAKAP